MGQYRIWRDHCRSACHRGNFSDAEGRLKAIALSGTDAPGIPSGTFVEFDTPVLNNRDEIAFVGTVRRGRETLQVFYLYSGGVLRKLVARVIQPRAAALLTVWSSRHQRQTSVPSPRSLNMGRYWVEFSSPAPANCTCWSEPERSAPEAKCWYVFRSGPRSMTRTTSLRCPSAAGVSSEALLIANESGSTQVGDQGETAPGGGRFSAFGPWPNFGRTDTSPSWRRSMTHRGPWESFGSPGAIRRVAMVGDRLATAGSFPLSPSTPSRRPVRAAA